MSDLDAVLREILTHNDAYEWKCSACGIERPDMYGDWTTRPPCFNCGSDAEPTPPEVLQ